MSLTNMRSLTVRRLDIHVCVCACIHIYIYIWYPPPPFRGLGFRSLLGQRARKRSTVPMFSAQNSKNAVLSQKKQSFRPKRAKMLYCPKKPKKQQFRNLGRQVAWRSTNFGFLVFLGQYSIFAPFASKRFVFFGQYSTFEAWECKNAVLSQKNQKNQSLETSRPWRSPRSPNFGFFGFFGTVQHFLHFLP